MNTVGVEFSIQVSPVIEALKVKTQNKDFLKVILSAKIDISV